MQKPINLIVQDTQNIIFEGEVDRITSFNEVGRFDIFPMHANFISIIYKELALYKNHQKIKEMNIEQAILKTKQDKAHIFLGVETLVTDEEAIIKEAEKKASEQKDK